MRYCDHRVFYACPRRPVSIETKRMSSALLCVLCILAMLCVMAKDLEAAREAGLISTYSADEAVGIAVNNLMFQRRVTRKQLGEALGITGPNAGRKLRGEIGWSLNDLFIASELLQIELRDILPQRVAQDGVGYLPVATAARGPVVAAAPSCPQRGSNPRPMD